jgi:protein involved in polysaccharide export with SLBB domain
MKSSHNRKSLLYALTLGAVLLCATPTVLHAQANPLIMQMVQGELNKRGITESEARVRLLQRGIDPESISPADYPKYKNRVIAVLDELQAEKKKSTSNPSDSTSKASQAVNINVAIPTVTPMVEGRTPIDQTLSNYRTTNGTSGPYTGTVPDLINPIAPVTTPEEAAAEASQRILQSENARETTANIYGHSVFTDHSLDVFRKTDGAQAPDTYVLGEGDEIRITIFGASQTDIQQRVSVSGSIQPAGMSKIFVKGLTLAQARNLIKERLASYYSFRNDQIAVSIVTARTVMVNIFGETKISGGFTLSALNSAFNALSAAGGPTSIGTVRNIELIRGQGRQIIDLYKFMEDPSTQFDFGLQNNDVLFVPMAKKVVNISGAVNRPMAYEMKEKEDLLDLIKLAGDVTKDVYPDFIQVQRYVNGEVKLYEWNLSEILSKKTIVALTNGDIVRIKHITKPLDQYVRIDGSLYYPGQFDLATNQMLSTLIKNAQPTYEAKTDVVFIERTRPDNTIEFLTIPFPGYQNAGDFKLEARDVVHIMNLASYRDVMNISVLGNVRMPFTRTFALNDKLSLTQAIEFAGGLKESAFPVAYVFRKNLFNTKEVKYIRIDLEKDTDFKLQAGDQLNIYDNATFSNIGEIRVSGAIKFSQSFTFNPTMTLHDLLITAGGFNVGAAYNRVEVFRTILSPVDKPKVELITLQVDSNYQLIKQKEFTLQPFDHVVVRMTPEFNLGRVIELNGEVKYPGVYVLESKETTLADIIKKAGGLLNDADPFGAKLFRTFRNRGDISINIRKAVTHPNSYNYNPVLFEGDVININRLENTVTILETGTRMAQYSINTDGNSSRNIVYQGPHSAKWYIRNYAGGFQKNADRNSVVVTYPNNQMQSTKRYLVFFNSYPVVQPGSIITMKMNAERVEADLKPKEKIDWEAALSKGLSTLMSTLSIVLLMQRL